ncbi:MAG: hypothetical protein GW839_01770 [Flavobacteriales bacterium]|nr:hypothetical protein [Flavobacteriia bacterium]NCP05418.1 hypothetical protein [Flavobacteriales bacterium]PIV94957.1 MAG: hypothetical protein COW44_01625 [Flavobacteriaceae bacterium CG17_big_fil_post_rev_8_21_14_2_50_33_15]PIY11397.1 MAG: hypothetical protein COZ17_06875 [Flavobacteriaceae bacterium CG_4_10_14_3_um_filter_33_47]PJB19188.1 MAG: hypothetical protein CO117_05595 [Flavobacteriaceae bacterium CG_4_9_14_3_um_filter_33_16]
MITQNKRWIGILGSATLILLVPLIAMQFTNEVKWELSDFIIAGILLFGTGLMLEMFMRKIKNKKNRIALIVILVALLILTWIELAVGIFGSPIAGS